MRALWDHPCLPYRAIAPWPVILVDGRTDWVSSVDYMESWLESNVGPHWAAWTWSMWSLHNSEFCGVSFSREKFCSMFLLKFSDQLTLSQRS